MDDDDTFTCRIQYINDADPFATTSSSYLEPMRPVTFKFRLHECISELIHFCQNPLGVREPALFGNKKIIF